MKDQHKIIKMKTLMIFLVQTTDNHILWKMILEVGTKKVAKSLTEVEEEMLAVETKKKVKKRSRAKRRPVEEASSSYPDQLTLREIQMKILLMLKVVKEQNVKNPAVRMTNSSGQLMENATI